MKSLFCQFRTDISEFGGQLAILIPITIRILNLNSTSMYV